MDDSEHVVDGPVFRDVRAILGGDHTVVGPAALTEIPTAMGAEWVREWARVHDVGKELPLWCADCGLPAGEGVVPEEGSPCTACYGTCMERTEEVLTRIGKEWASVFDGAPRALPTRSHVLQALAPGALTPIWLRVLTTLHTKRLPPADEVIARCRSLTASLREYVEQLGSASHAGYVVRCCQRFRTAWTTTTCLPCKHADAAGLPV